MILQKHVVQYGAKVWIPSQKQEEGLACFSFHKWDRGFVRFVQGGKSLDFRKMRR